MEQETDVSPPSLGVIVLLIAIPILAGGSLFLLFPAGPIHRLGLYLIGAGVLVGGVLLLWREG